MKENAMTMTNSTKKSSTQATTTTTTPVAPVAPAQPTAPAAPPPTDPNAALAALVQQAVTQLDAIDATLGSDPPLTPTEKRHAARMRKGGAAILATIANLATQHDLESPAMQVTPMTTEVGTASALQPLVNRLAALSNRVNNLVFTAQSSAWVSGMKFYAILQRQAATDTDLTTALQPVTQFFAYRHPTVKAVGTPTKPQKKATKKALDTLTKTAPQLLAPPTPAEAPAVPPAPASPATPVPTKS
jgi:hypothetical protein